MKRSKTMVKKKWSVKREYLGRNDFSWDYHYNNVFVRKSDADDFCRLLYANTRDDGHDVNLITEIVIDKKGVQKEKFVGFVDNTTDTRTVVYQREI